MLRLARETGARSVTFSAAYDAASLGSLRELQSALEEAGLRATLVHDAPAVPPDETAAARSDDGGRGYRALGPYVAAWTAQAREPFAERVRFATETPPSEPLPEAAAYDAPAGAEVPDEAAALAAFEAYLTGPALQYGSARNVPGGEPTARLSAALSFGVVSARTLLARIDERSRDPFLLTEERLSLRALTHALARRDFFLQLGWFFEAEPDAALQARMRGFPLARTHPRLEAWRDGQTGFPLVDAGARQLRETGWMHPRVRQVAASFLCFDLGVDWRVGRDAWDAELVEDDPALATGNWQWVAGVGADLAQFPRIYNPRKQARAFDPAATYVRRWISELRDVTDAEIFDGDAAQRRPQLALPFATHTYPAPVLDHETAARAYLTRYGSFARGTAVRNG